ncbi:uncharacterized protein Z518_11312 [Rhinocladiella mackenziei CBS 650.93]|uniref:AMP-dependent synthetase/ligase domain-containing protein n=1 Tax=Rhinocladiella mackenziei CBS 650.93 TaxID=1442369 RepID=A0A0D2I1H7_9EURO|nr:uncharacterized protein Z518_11312 [Rhinocladiella mackenziei CBS 650.93]KIW99573.1 hypothetical protein Z518_11312 [Rhinocladiella mackenziei CBS 650.93]
MPISSNYPDVQLREADIFSFLFVRDDLPFAEDKVIFQDADESALRYTYADGDVIALFTPNSIDVPAVVFGALWTGAVLSSANPGYTVGELEFQLRDCGARYLIAHQSSLPTARKACARVGIPESRIILVGISKSSSVGIQKVRHWTSIRDAGTNSVRVAPPQINPKEDLAFLAYSSGTTSAPKGVRLTHFNVTANIQQMRPLETVTCDGSIRIPGIPDAPRTGDKALACLPFFHIYGLTCMMINPLYTGIECVLMGSFDIERWRQAVQKHRITVGYLVPPILLLLCKHPAADKYDLSSLRICSSGAAPLTRELVETVFNKRGLRVKQGYGLTETSPTLFAMRWQDWHSRVGTTGLLVPNMRAKFHEPFDEEMPNRKTKELPRGEVGELYVQGPNIFHGYHNNPAATAECLRDGWFRTGDVGFMDAEGNLTITDRAKELIKYKGFQVAPAQLEGLLIDNDIVDDAAVVGVSLPEQATEAPRAHYKLRGGVRFIDAIPKTASGKILRRTLKELVKQEAQASSELKSHL